MGRCGGAWRRLRGAKVDVAAHARAAGNGDRIGLQIADHDACLQHIYVPGLLDIAMQFAGDDYRLGLHGAFHTAEMAR